LFLSAIALVAIWGFSRGQGEVEVWTAPATYQDLSQQVTTNGTVVPTSEFQARAFWPGIIDKVSVGLGDKVKPGQLLVSMKDPFAVSRMTAADAALQGWLLREQNIRNGGSQIDRIDLHGNLAQAQLEQAKAKSALAALQQLQQTGAASPAEVAAAEEKLKAANASLATIHQKSTEPYTAADLRDATSHVADAQANVDSAKVQFNNANIATPISGTVYSVKVEAYDWVPVGADLVRVADLNSVEVRAFFDEPEIGKLAAGQPVKIKWDGRPDRTWHGHIKQSPIAATALGARSVGECIIAVDDAKEDLFPNTNVTVTVTVEQHPHVLAIPRAALHADATGKYVFCVVGGRLRRTPVDAGIVTLDRAEVTHGLTFDQAVVLNTVDDRELRDDMQVRIANGH
jgi:HlyD family secretion protein